MLSKQTDLKALQAEAESLAEFLRKEVRTFAAGHRPVKLEPGAPAAAAMLWKAVGWSPAFEKSGLMAPERKTGEARIQQLLKAYRSWGAGFTLTSSDLPAKRRLVDDDDQGVGFAITDERPGEIDAPTLAVIADTNQLVAEAKSYTRYCAHAMAEFAFERMYETTVHVRPAGALAKAGRQPWPLLLPGARQVASDVYCVPPSAGATEPHRKGRYQLAHRSVDALVELLQSLSCEKIGFESLPGDFLRLQKKLTEVVRKTDEVRKLSSMKSGVSYGIGQLGGVPVVLEGRGSTTSIHTNPRRIANLKTVLKQRGMKP